MKRPFAGTWTALITPFTKEGDVDETALRKLVRKQIEGGITGVLALGTTGESPTTTHEEDVAIFKIVVNECKGSGVKVMAGCGSNCTRDAIKYTITAREAGADIGLAVSPYYNKPTQRGLKLHFEAMAEVGLPLCLYNIKGRTGVNIETDTLMELAEHPNITAVKEASGDLNQIKNVIDRRPENFTVFSGDDGLTLDVIKLGGDGVISVASNIMPREVTELVESALAGDMKKAEEINEKLKKLFKDIFIETNPIPVKYLAYLMGLCEREYRLPMCPPSPETEKALRQTAEFYQLL